MDISETRYGGAGPRPVCYREEPRRKNVTDRYFSGRWRGSKLRRVRICTSNFGNTLRCAERAPRVRIYPRNVSTGGTVLMLIALSLAPTF